MEGTKFSRVKAQRASKFDKIVTITISAEKPGGARTVGGHET